MRKIVIAAALAALFACAAAVRAEIPNRSPEQLRQDASHILTGTVRAVYSFESPVENEREHAVFGQYAAEILIDAVEKGEGLAPKTVTYVRFRKLLRAPDGWAGGSGSRLIPATGSRVRAFVRREADGTVELVLPNGFEVLDAPKR